MPSVSVIIPNYNHAPYLKQRIDSVLNQTFRDFEVIILDDYSSDNSRNIIEQYRHHERVSGIVYNTENSGNTFKQWDKGIKLAKGDYIWIAESDDWCEVSLLETIVGGLEKDNTCVLGYCQSYLVQDNVIKFQSSHTQLTEYVDGKKFIKDYIMPRNPIFNAGMAVWRRNAYDKISKDYVNYKIIGDHYFWIELCECGTVFISGKLLNYFRTHEKNVSFNAVKNGHLFIEQIPLLKQLLDRKTISRDDYLSMLKRLYLSFRGIKNMPKENSDTIKKLFSSVPYELRFYFLKNKISILIKRFLRA